MFIGSNGPCTLSVNIGGKIFHSPHEEMNRGLIDINQGKLLPLNKKGQQSAISGTKKGTKAG